MAFNSLSLTEKVFTRIPLELDREQEVFLRYAIAQWIEDALYRLARGTAASPDQNVRAYLQRDYTLALSGGSGALSGAAGTGLPAEPFFYDAIEKQSVSHPSSTWKMQYLPRKSELDMPRPAAFIYYTIFDGQVFTRNTDGLTTSLGGTMSFTANYLPLLGSVPKQLESQLVDEMMGIAKEKLGDSSFLSRAMQNDQAREAAKDQEEQRQAMMREQQGQAPSGQKIPDVDQGRGAVIG